MDPHQLEKIREDLNSELYSMVNMKAIACLHLDLKDVRERGKKKHPGVMPRDLISLKD